MLRAEAASEALKSRAAIPTGGFTFGPTKTTATTSMIKFTFCTCGTGGLNLETTSQSMAGTPSSALFSLSNPIPATQTTGFIFTASVASTPAPGGTRFPLGINAPKLNLSHTAST